MNGRGRRVLIAGVCAMAGIVSLAAQSSAAPRAPGSGTFAVTSSKLTTVNVGPVKLYEIRQVVKWTGPISGTAQEFLWETVTPSGTAWAGVDVCACVAKNGGKGTVTIRLSQGTDNGKTYHGAYTVTAGTGALSGFSGHGTLSGSDAKQRGTYTGAFTG